MIQDGLKNKDKDIRGVQKQASELLSCAWQKGYIAGFNDGYATRRNADEYQHNMGYADARRIYERTKGEREFIEILAQYVPEGICTYPEYRGKPYYSIHYKENGEDFVGFGTYNPEVLSEYLREYFIGADTRVEE